GPLGERLARWVPPRPSTPLGRVVAAGWAAPLTAVGILVALAGGRLPHWDATRGCLIARGVGGPSRRALGSVGADANTIGQVVLCRQAQPGAPLLDHESVHVRQGERLGMLLPISYAWASARHGYRDNPFERAARQGAADQLEASDH
ncbi:MAG: hypothetical protein JJT89_17930, partial [Nitriliruptoraceae bacterium]|nr:hypothetical protein [Nitriliruptoraceae bacterium]